MVRILLIRHGQSTWNELGKWQGQQNPPLTEQGRRQAHAAAEALGDIIGIAASDLDRAAETARIIATERGLPAPLTFPALRERAAGPWEGLTRSEIEAGWPGYLETFTRPEGWEDDDALIDRVLPALREIARTLGDSPIGVITHAGNVLAFERRAGEEHERLPNLGGRWIHLDDETWVLGDRVSLLPAELETTPGQI